MLLRRGIGVVATFMMSIQEPQGLLLTVQGIKNGEVENEDKESGGLDACRTNDRHVANCGVFHAGISWL